VTYYRYDTPLHDRLLHGRRAGTWLGRWLPVRYAASRPSSAAFFSATVLLFDCAHGGKLSPVVWSVDFSFTIQDLIVVSHFAYRSAFSHTVHRVPLHLGDMSFAPIDVFVAAPFAFRHTRPWYAGPPALLHQQLSIKKKWLCKDHVDYSVHLAR
jgi:hypothetical protein